MISGLLLLAMVLTDAQIDRLVARAPAPVRSFIERRSSCNHWAGEEPYDKERAREIDSALRAGRCDRLDADLDRLNRRYAARPSVRRLLDLTADRDD